MNYVIQTYGNSLISRGLGGKFSPTSGSLTLTGVVPDNMISINIYINTRSTSGRPIFSYREGLDLIDSSLIDEESEGIIFYSGVFMATASTVKLVFSNTLVSTGTTYGFSAMQLSLS